MPADAPRLWSFEYSPFAGKVRVALAEKGVEYELVEIDPGRRPERLGQLNPTNTVPVLEVGDTALRESSVICEWLEETVPDPPLWPADPVARARARGWSKWIDDRLAANFFGSMRRAAWGLREGDPPDIVERLRAKLVAGWPVLEAELARTGGPWVAGEQVAYADLGGAAIAVRIPMWVPEVAPDPAATPLAAAWLDAVRARPSTAAIEARGEPVLSGDDD